MQTPTLKKVAKGVLEKSFENVQGPTKGVVFIP